MKGGREERVLLKGSEDGEEREEGSNKIKM